MNNPPLRFFQRGVFTADGNGHLSSGMDDVSLLAGGIFSNPFTGTYSLSSDGTGTLTFNFSGVTTSFKAVIANSSTLYIAQNDGVVPAAGLAEKQDISAFAIPQGTFIFETHLLTWVNGNASLSTATVGMVSITNGSVSGQEDVNDKGVFSSRTLTGSFAAPDSNGRGTGSFTDSASNTLNFIYYIQDANHLYFVPSSPPGTFAGAGQAEKQSAGPFTVASLSGGYAFGSEGESAFSQLQVRSAGRLTALGDGSISGGVYDSISDTATTPISNTAFTGSYIVAATGRIDVTLTPPAGSIHEVLWLVSPSRAYLLIDDSTKVEDGTLDLQSGSSSAATMNGKFVITAKTALVDRVGTLTGDGATGLSLTIFVPASADFHSTGTYAVTGDGRATASLPGFSDECVFYLASSSQGYFLSTDSSLPANGLIGKVQ